MRISCGLLSVCLVIVAAQQIPEAQQAAGARQVDGQPPVAAQQITRKKTILGSVFEVDLRFEGVIGTQIERARETLGAQRRAGKLVAYISTPISARGGGHEPTNLAISAFVKKRLEGRYGRRLYALDPGEFALPAVEGKEAGGGDYLFMWTEILAGSEGLGRDFDLVYFVGPTDAAAFFEPHRPKEGGLLDALAEHLRAQQEKHPALRKELADPGRRRAFEVFYGLRASVAWSKGAHDEWNLFVRLNRKRATNDLGEQIAMHFDGRALSPAEMQQEIAPGYELPPSR